jgi:hypothetical protein
MNASECNQLEEDLAKIERDRNDYLRFLADCRDALPVPEIDTVLEGYWLQAMGDPGCIPAYIQQYVKERNE